jgi:hypothetical protein
MWLCGVAAGVELPVLAIIGSQAILRFSELFAQEEQDEQALPFVQAAQSAPKVYPRVEPQGELLVLCGKRVWQTVFNGKPSKAMYSADLTTPL